jgi:hypothetical protein
MSSPTYPYTWPVEHDNNDDASLYTVVAAAVLLARLKSALANKALVVNPELPFPRQTGQQCSKSLYTMKSCASTTCVCVQMISSTCMIFYMGLGSTVQGKQDQWKF